LQVAAKGGEDGDQAGASECELVPEPSVVALGFSHSSGSPSGAELPQGG